VVNILLYPGFSKVKVLSCACALIEGEYCKWVKGEYSAEKYCKNRAYLPYIEKTLETEFINPTTEFCVM